MDCSLWLNRKKIDSAAQIPDNLDVASLRGYFLAGSLIEWLKGHGGKRYAAKLAKLSHDDPSLNEKIAAIFGGTPLPSKLLDGADARCGCDTQCSYLSGVAGSLKMPDSFNITNSSFWASGSYSSFSEISSVLAYLSEKYGSFSISSFFGGSFFEWAWEWLFGYSGGSFVSTSFSETSYSQWEWLLQLLRGYSSGSFVSTSFSETSYSQWEWLLQLLRGYSSGSFVSTSFSETSYSQWEWLLQLLRGYSSGSFVSTSYSETSFSQWEWFLQLLRGYSSGSFTSTSFSSGSFSQWKQFFEMFGSFPGGSFPGKIPFEIDEYDFIMFKTLMICPLDRFGYGIHII